MKQLIDNLCSKEKEIDNFILNKDYDGLNNFIKDIYYSDNHIPLKTDFYVSDDILKHSISTMDLLSNVSSLLKNNDVSNTLSNQNQNFDNDKESILNTPLIQIIDKF